MAVIGRLVPLAFGVVFALSGAVGPIIGQNYGAGQMDRVKRTFYDALLFTGVVVVVIALALFLLRDPIAALFALEQGPALALLYAFCGPLAILFYFNGAIFVVKMQCSIIWGIPIIPRGSIGGATPLAPFHSST